MIIRYSCLHFSVTGIVSSLSNVTSMILKIINNRFTKNTLSHPLALTRDWNKAAAMGLSLTHKSLQDAYGFDSVSPFPVQTEDSLHSWQSICVSSPLLMLLSSSTQCETNVHSASQHPPSPAAAANSDLYASARPPLM